MVPFLLTQLLLWNLYSPDVIDFHQFHLQELLCLSLIGKVSCASCCVLSHVFISGPVLTRSPPHQALVHAYLMTLSFFAVALSLLCVLIACSLHVTDCFCRFVPHFLMWRTDRWSETTETGIEPLRDKVETGTGATTLLDYFQSKASVRHNTNRLCRDSKDSASLVHPIACLAPGRHRSVFEDDAVNCHYPSNGQCSQFNGLSIDHDLANPDIPGCCYPEMSPHTSSSVLRHCSRSFCANLQHAMRSDCLFSTGLPPSPTTSTRIISLTLGTAQAVTLLDMHYHRRVRANRGLVASRDVASRASILGLLLVWTVLGKDMYRPIA